MDGPRSDSVSYAVDTMFDYASAFFPGQKVLKGSPPHAKVSSGIFEDEAWTILAYRGLWLGDVYSA